MSGYAKCKVLNHTVEFKMIPTSGYISVGCDGWLVGNYQTVREAMFAAAEHVRMVEHDRERPTIPEETWLEVEEFAAPAPVMVEVASADETIRLCGGLDEFAGLEHPAMDAACEAYRRAVCVALAGAGRLEWCDPRGQRLLHSGWCGAKWGYSIGAIGAMAPDLTEEEKATIGAAHDAGLEAARKVIAEADAAASA